MKPARYTEVLDELIATTFRAARDDFAVNHTMLGASLAVVATDQYGAGNVAPEDPINLLILGERRMSAFAEAISERILYALSDAGADVGLACRTVAECVQLARTDATVAESLQHMRHIAGDASLFVELKNAFPD